MRLYSGHPEYVCALFQHGYRACHNQQAYFSSLFHALGCCHIAVQGPEHLTALYLPVGKPGSIINIAPMASWLRHSEPLRRFGFV